MMISRSIRIKIRNVSDRIFRENQNTHFMFNNVFFFRKSCRLWYSVEKYSVAGKVAVDNTVCRMRFAC